MSPLASPAEVEQAIDQVRRLYRAVEDLRAQVGTANSRKYGILSEGPIAQIRALLAEIDAYAATAGAADPTLWMRVEGHGIQWPSAPTSVLTALLEILRKGVQAVAEFSSRGALGTRPTAALKRACDLRVVALVPGSLGVGVQIPAEAELAGVARGALDIYLQAAAWAGSDDPDEALAVGIPDAPLRLLALAEVARLVPRQRGDVELVELSGTPMAARAPAVLRRQTRERISRMLSPREEQVVELTGDLREIDLDSRSFILRNVEQISETRCEFTEELLDAAKEALDKRIQVKGTRVVQGGLRSSARLLVRQLEILDDEDSGQ